MDIRYITDTMPRNAAFPEKEPQRLDYVTVRRDPNAVVPEQIVAAFSTQRAAEDYADWMGSRLAKGEPV